MENETVGKLEICVDPNTKQISVGNWVAGEMYYNYPMRESYVNLKKQVLRANGIDISEGHDLCYIGHNHFIPYTMCPLTS